MNNRRKLVLALGASALSFPLSSLAQSATKIWRIGYMTQRPGPDEQTEGLQRGLRELGYVEGQNLIIEWRFSKGKGDLLPGFAAELVRLKVDCIVSSGTLPTRAAKQATQTIPIVMANSEDDPVRTGLIVSLARPGGNVTGFTGIGSELAGKRLQLLKETVPRASRVAILWDPNSSGLGHVREARIAARKLGVQLQSLEVWDAEDLDPAFRAAGKERAEALMIVAAGLTNVLRTQIIDRATKSRLPAMYSNSAFVQAGGLMSYAADSSDHYPRVAGYVDRILKGTKPADLAVQQPTKFEFIINAKAAKQIGLTIPRDVLVRADKVIE
jgi:putative ABC transport system substrate-binding protein